MQDTREINTENSIKANIAMCNLELIYNSNPQILHKTDFIDSNNNQLKNSLETISLLIELDLIETEIDKDLYFLTPEGYDVVEHWGIENIQKHINSNIIIEEVEEDDSVSFLNEEDQLKLNNKETRNFNGNFFVKWILYAIFISLIYYIFN